MEVGCERGAAGSGSWVGREAWRGGCEAGVACGNEGGHWGRWEETIGASPT